jgi:hypothetical protein
MGESHASFAAVMCARDREIAMLNGVAEAATTAATRAPRARKRTI